MKKFSFKNFSVGRYRLLLCAVRASEITSGVVCLQLQYVMLSHQTDDVFLFDEDVVNWLSNPRSKEFFDFLEESDVKFDEYDDLVGLTFDADITFEQLEGWVYPIITRRELIGKPTVSSK